MASVNKVIFIGNLGRDPEIKTLPSGDAITNFSIAVTEKYKENESTEWIRCTAFGKIGENIAKYCKKGSSIYVEGKWRSQKYTKEGVEITSVDVRVSAFQALSFAKMDAVQGNQHPDGCPTYQDDDLPF